MRIDPLNRNYPIRLRTITVLVILTLALLAYLFPRFLGEANQVSEVKDVSDLKIVDIPPDIKSEIPDRPERPTIPVPSDDITLDSTKTIEELDWNEDFSFWDEPPKPKDTNWAPFIAWDRPPQALTPITPEYPEDALRLGIEGTVRVQVYIDKHGIIQNIKVYSSDSVMLDEAALDAVKRTKWDPARQRDKKVDVNIIIPIEFTLD
ncbi:MAG: energy transducer TonB [Fidelibacterota bacterium]